MPEKGWGGEGAPEQVVDNKRDEEIVLRKLLTANNVKKLRNTGKL
jgi:hypothetical protein